MLFEDEDVKRRFKIAPAAKTMHHAYLSEDTLYESPVSDIPFIEAKGLVG